MISVMPTSRYNDPIRWIFNLHRNTSLRRLRSPIHRIALGMPANVLR